MHNLVLILSFSVLALLADENLQEKNILNQIEKEKKYKEEQKFYQGKNFNLDSFEVDDKSLKSIPDQPDYNDDFDMNNVYD